MRASPRPAVSWRVAALTFRNLAKPRLLAFILIMSGFWLMFMQLFDMLPNFIVDWVDSRSIVTALNVPHAVTSETPRGRMGDGSEEKLVDPFVDAPRFEDLLRRGRRHRVRRCALSARSFRRHFHTVLPRRTHAYR